MPIPTKRKKDDKQAFIKRCMSSEAMKREYKDKKQRIAVCLSQWKK